MDPQVALSLLDDLLPRLRRLAAAVCGRGPGADDLVARAWEDAIRDIDRFDGEQRFDLWIVGRLVRLFLSKQTASELDAGEQLARLRSMGAMRVSADNLMAAMSELPPLERGAVALVCVEGLSYSESARCLGVPVKELVTRLTAGRRALIQGLGGIDALIGEEAA